MSVSFFSIIILALWVLVLVVGVYLLLSARRRADTPPSCGECGYNLTGCTANRCPECGRLFIEAGVIIQTPWRSRPRTWAGLVILGVSVVLMPCLGAGLLSVTQARRAAAAQAQALAQSRFLEATLNAAEPGTAPQAQQIIDQARKQIEQLEDAQLRAALEEHLQGAEQALEDTGETDPPVAELHDSDP